MLKEYSNILRNNLCICSIRSVITDDDADVFSGTEQNYIRPGIGNTLIVEASRDMLKHLPIGFYSKCILSQHLPCSFLCAGQLLSVVIDRMQQMGQIEFRFKNADILLQHKASAPSMEFTVCLLH